MSEIKEFQQVNNLIPIKDWEDFEDLYQIEKRKDPGRKLKKKDFFIMVFLKGISNWLQ